MRRTNDIAVCMDYEDAQTETQCPQPLCKKAAQRYLNKLKHNFGGADVARPNSEKILILACLVTVNSEIFVDYRLPF
ncbi:hypothetical protein JCM19235_5974 [Vibrio maritimus]|uniref:Uncharacterized protein n=1 Tax=Vibrio maritimus TaxID=990268 RepID=A0A090RPU8_9VIBR|nr:hypothetical protein JCM19235_5974 [Vibrio maritimus]